MKFTIKNDDLHNLISSANDVSKNANAIHIIAERHGDVPGETPPDTEARPAEVGQIRVIAYNENMVSEWRRPAEIEMTGDIAIHPEGLDRLIKASRKTDSTFSIETIDTNNEKSLRLATSRSAHEFPGVSSDIFETISPGHTSGERVNLENLALAINTAKVSAASRGEAAGGRIMLTGVHIQKRDDLFDIVGTDGKRLSLTKLKAVDLGGLDLGEREGGVTIPPESIGLITEMLGSGPASFEVLGNNIVIENSEGSLSVRMIDAPYPHYAPLVQQETDQSISIPKASLETALQRSSVALARDKRSVAVKMSRGSDGIYITSAASGQSSSECISDEPGDDISIGFDAQYMQQAIAVYGLGDVVLNFSGESVPIRITSKTNPEILMLVMPCKIG